MSDDIQQNQPTPEDDFEEISSDEVDSVVTVLETLAEKVESENIKDFLEEAASNIYYLVYEDEDEEGEDEAAQAA